MPQEKIDVASLLRRRAPGLARFVPRWAVRRLEEFICQNRLNQILTECGDLEGVEFAEAVLRNLGVTFTIRGEKPDPGRRAVIVSNHPLGGLDGLVLCSAVSRMYGRSDLRVVVNDLLTAIGPLRGIFLGVNKHGAQSRTSAEAIERAFAGDAPIVMFPAGLCSRMQPDGTIRDLDWNKMAVVKAISSQRDIIPVHFSGHNSSFFYKFARLRTLLGIKFNYEMIRLPRELLYNEGASFTVTVGKAIPPSSLTGGHRAGEQASRLRDTVYALDSGAHTF